MGSIAGFLAIAAGCLAQQVNWLRHYGNAGGYNSGFILEHDLQGHIYGTGVLVAETVFDSHTATVLGDRDALLAKWDTAGNVIWVRTAGGEPAQLQSDADGGADIAYDPVSDRVVMAGRYSSPNTFFGPHVLSGGSDFESDVFVASYDAQGNCLWAKGAIGFTASSQGLLVDGNSNVYSFGYCSFGGATFYEATTINIPQGGSMAKYDVDGNFVSALQTVSLGGIYDAQWVENDWLVCGQFVSGSTLWGQPVAVQSPGGDGFVARIDTTGAIIWYTSLRSDSAVTIYHCAATSDGKVMVAGVFNENLYVNGDTIEGDPLVLNHFIAFLDEEGSVLWAKVLMVSDLSITRDLEVSANDEFYIMGRLEDQLNLGNTVLTASTSRDGYLARFDTVGNCLAASHFGRVRYAVGSVLCAEEGLYLSCDYDSTMNFSTYTVPVSLLGFTDMFLARLDSLSGFTGIQRITENNEELHIYANPNNGLCIIDLPQSLQASDGLVLSVYDNTGQLVQRAPLEFTEQGLKLDVRAQAKGVYHVELSDGAQRYSGSIVFE
ncbi:MAG: T9SS type A sorting domain-containing protein [Flavobacteriales bacterium]